MEKLRLFFNFYKSIFECAGVIVSLFLSFITLFLHIRQSKFEKKIKEEEVCKHCNNIIYLINEIAYKLADTEIEKNSFKAYMFDFKSYSDDINFLNSKILSKKECDILMELIFKYKELLSPENSEISAIKAIYNFALDKYMHPEAMLDARNNKSIDDAVSIELAMILYKLQKAMNPKYQNNSKITEYKTDRKGNYSLKRNYSNGKYIKYSNDVKNGEVKEYEKVFNSKIKEKFYVTKHERIYEGGICDNLKDGCGKYYYYSMENGFNCGVNSHALSQVNINLDKNAQKMVELFKERNIDYKCCATFEGQFKNDLLISGKIKYKEKPNDVEKEFLI